MTGECLMQVNLSEAKTKDDLVRLINRSQFQRGNWILGFGWDENKFSPEFELNKNILDEISKDKFIFLVRADGHSSCVNSKVIELLNFDKKEKQIKFGNFIELSKSGETTGLLRESAHMQVYEHLPNYEKEQLNKLIQASTKKFIQQGFTYIRDMTTRLSQWEAELDLYESGNLNIFIEHNFSCENINDVDRTLADISRAKRQETDRLKVRGIKIFYDGSLGSRTAALSRPYADQQVNLQTNQDDDSGSVLWQKQDVQDVIRRAWELSFDVSIHVIGDRAVSDVVDIAKNVSAKGLLGRLNLEHVQVLSPETIKSMKPLHVVCHMQPCHWLSDRAWLKERLGPLHAGAFSWEKLNRAGVPIQFGSDSPIEEPSLANNLLALTESQKNGIVKLSGDPILHHCYRQIDKIESESHFDEKFNVEKVFFNKKLVFETQTLK